MMNEGEGSTGKHYLETVRSECRRLKSLAEKAIAQVGDERRLHTRLDGESNSIAVLIRHLNGNMLSRWTDFRTTDGEKPSRDRDGEFEPRIAMTRGELMEVWNQGWGCFMSAIDSLSPDELRLPISVRGERSSVMEAIERQLAHYACHVGQIVFLAKHFESDRWESLSIPRGRSADFYRRDPGPADN